ncbi:MAG TPA: DUF4230 domain-containing protein [Chloroflexota bacterium]|nr:DUF4230 domain-containing protein [Chloroflexota bacterium]
MRYTVTALIGAFLGVAALLLVQDIRDVICHTPLVGSIICSPAPTVSVASPQPTTTPTPPSIDWKVAGMVHKTIYSEKEYSARFEEKRDYVVIAAKALLQKTIVAVTSGSCSAGIDYEAKPPQAEVAGTRVTVRLPEPAILDCSTRSLEYVDGNWILPAPTDLYNTLADRAINEISTRAEQSDLVAKARESAAIQTELYLRRLGFQQVSIEFLPDR